MTIPARRRFGSLPSLWRLSSRAFALAAVCALGLTPFTASAQQLPPDVSPQQALQYLQGMQQGTTQAQPIQQPVILAPAPERENEALPTSRLELLISSRIGFDMHLFGYADVGIGGSIVVPQTGAVQDAYVLGPGDQLDVSLRGQVNDDFTVTVDRNGQVTLPKLSPLAAAGRTMAEFRKDLNDAVHNSYVQTTASVAVDQLRQVTVTVSGDVANPGARILTGLSSPLDAIVLSGGIEKAGSLRNVELFRDGHEMAIDLYNILLAKHGQAPQITLRDGDRIVVPPIGVTVAIAGAVRRPAIYELPPGQRSITVHEAVELAAGSLVPGVYTSSILRMMPNGRLQYVDVSSEPNAPVYDSDILVVKPTYDIAFGRVNLAGAVRTPGAFALNKYQTLHDLLPSAEALAPGAYVLFGVIDRIDPTTMQHQALPFSPLHVIEGKENLKLISDDYVHVLTEDGMHALLHIAENQQQAPQPPSLEQTQTQQNGAAPGGVPGAPGSAGTPAAPGVAPAGTVAPGAPGMPAGMQSPGTAALMQSILGAQAGANGQAGAGGQIGAPGGAPMGAYGAPAGAYGAAAAGGTAGAYGATAGMAGAAGGTIGAYGATAGATGDGGTTSAFGATANSGAVDMGGFTSDEASFFGNALGDYRASINGAVQTPGDFLVAPNTTLADAMLAVHGLTIDADLSSFELTSLQINNNTGTAQTIRKNYPATPEELAKIVLKPFDSIMFHYVYSDKEQGDVTIGGEVRYPGDYSILRGERLSSVLTRAGGLTEVAYPYGTVFLRGSVARIEGESNRKAAADLRSQLFNLLAQPSVAGATAPSADAIVALQSMLAEIENAPALGRVSIIADPAALAAHPDKDPILQPGDTIMVPRRPSSVSIMGEVMRPGAIPFDNSMSIGDYLDRVGGFTQYADDARVILVLPDGSASVVDESWSGFGTNQKIPPGSTIFVPRDLTALDLHTIIVDTSQIFTQLATSAAAVAILSKNL